MAGWDLVPLDVERADEAALAAWHEVHLVLEGEELPGDPPEPFAQRLAEARTPRGPRATDRPGPGTHRTADAAEVAVARDRGRRGGRRRRRRGPRRQATPGRSPRQPPAKHEPRGLWHGQDKVHSFSCKLRYIRS